MHLGPLTDLYGTPGAPKRARFGPEWPFWGPRRSSEGPQGPDLVPTASHRPVWVGLMVTTHFHLVSGPFWAPGGPKRARFGPKCPFWGPRRSSEGPGGPDLVPTASHWPVWVGLMVTTHFDLVSAPSGPPGTLKGPVSAQNAPFGALGGPRGAKFGPDCPRLVRLGWTHAHHIL